MHKEISRIVYQYSMVSLSDGESLSTDNSLVNQKWASGSDVEHFQTGAIFYRGMARLKLGTVYLTV